MNTEPEEHPLGEVFSDLAQNPQARQLFWNQVEAFRHHLLRAMLAILVGVVIAFVFTQQLVDFLSMPIGGLDKLVAIEVTEPFSIYMKVTLLAGFAIAIPYIAFELWAFAAPGLRPRERWYGLVGIPLAVIFFISGMAFTYYILLPAALPYLVGLLGFHAQLRPQSYFSFVTGLMFWIGVCFEFPLVIYVLTAMGLVKPQVLARQWRIAIVVIAIIAALGPTVDALSMFLTMLPMIGLYLISIGLSYIAYAGRGKPAEQKTAQEAAK